MVEESGQVSLKEKARMHLISWVIQNNYGFPIFYLSRSMGVNGSLLFQAY